MSTETQIQKAYEKSLDVTRKVFGADKCDLIGPTFVEGGAQGDTKTLGPVATNLDCFVEEISGASAQTVVGGETYISTHSIELKRTAATLAITLQYKIPVHARGDNAARIFENPVIPEQSFRPLIIVKASLVRQGYQQ